MYIHISIYIYTYVCNAYTYIYIYIYRERERDIALYLLIYYIRQGKIVTFAARSALLGIGFRGLLRGLNHDSKYIIRGKPLLKMDNPLYGKIHHGKSLISPTHRGPMRWPCDARGERRAVCSCPPGMNNILYYNII